MEHVSFSEANNAPLDQNIPYFLWYPTANYRI